MITVAIIGAGIGAEHLDGYRALPDLFRVKTLCDLDVVRAQAVVGDDAISVSGALDSVLADPDVDLVDVCLPPHLHLPVTTKVLNAGKDAICEKPLVTSLAEADRLIANVTDTGRKLYPVFQYRYGRAMDHLRALGAAGLLGRPYAASLETHWRRTAEYYAVDWRGTWAGENGGAVLGHAIHNHDLIGLLMGPPRRVAAFVDTRVNAIETEDCAAVSLQMESGALVTSSVTLGAAADRTRVQLCYEHLTATSGDAPYAPMDADWRFVARDPARQAEVDTVIAGVPPGRAGYAGFLQAIAADLTGGQADVVTPEDGRRSLELVAAIYHAARSGEVVKLPLPPNHPLAQGWHPD